MSNSIEHLIRENREAFDYLEPQVSTWTHIESQVKHKTFTYSLMWKVAAVLFLLTTVSLVISNLSENVSSSQLADQAFLQEEIKFIQIINEEKKQLNALDIATKNQDLLFEESELGRTYQDLKILYLSNPSDDRIKDRLIENLRLRGQILMEQIEFLRSLNPKENDPVISAS